MPSWAYTSDADGNTLTGGGRTNTWDSQNRLVSCVFNGTTSTFKYGADGLRRQATVNGVTTDYVYDGSTLIREMMKNTQTGVLYNTATYLTGPRGPECRIDDTQQTEGYYNPADASPRPVHSRGVTKWYVYDGLGSVVGEMDFNGNLTSSPKYDVYGLVRSNGGTASSKMGFVGGLGHLSEANTGLIYMRARYYDPNIGRFSSEDPSKNGINWFIYASNDPVNRVDTNGRIDDSVVEFFLKIFLTVIGHDYHVPLTAPGAGVDGLLKQIRSVQSAIRAARVGEDIAITEGTIEADSPAAIADPTETEAAAGSLEAESGLAGKAVGAETLEQLDLLVEMITGAGEDTEGYF